MWIECYSTYSIFNQTFAPSKEGIWDQKWIYSCKIEFKTSRKNLPQNLRIHQLHFLTHIGLMDPFCLPRQVINSQMNANGTCTWNVATTTTKRAHHYMALEKVGLCQNSKKGIRTSEWIKCLKIHDTAELIQEILGLKHGSFKRGKKRKKKKRKYLISCSLNDHTCAHTTELMCEHKCVIIIIIIEDNMSSSGSLCTFTNQ